MVNLAVNHQCWYYLEPPDLETDKCGHHYPFSAFLFLLKLMRNDLNKQSKKTKKKQEYKKTHTHTHHSSLSFSHTDKESEGWLCKYLIRHVSKQHICMSLAYVSSNKVFDVNVWIIFVPLRFSS